MAAVRESTYLNARQAAERLRIHYITALRWLSEGKLKAEKDESGDWRISEAEIDRHLESKRSRFDEWVNRSAQAESFGKAVREGFWAETFNVRKQAEAVVLAGRDLDGMTKGDPRAVAEHFEQFESAIGDLRAALGRRAGFEALYPEAVRLEAEAAALEREAGDEFNGEIARRREKARKGR
jgi:excisionase family DNA binding protein